MAGYNNYFPQSYTNVPYTYGAGTISVPNQLNTSNISNQVGAINWVQGEAGARSMPVAPGQKVLLMDSETNVFYVKSSDSSGMPLPLRTFEYKELNLENEEVNRAQPKYVTHEELEQILSKFKPIEQPDPPKQKEEKKNEFII